MSLDLTAVGYQTRAYEFKYGWKAPVLYALGIGATCGELDYLLEQRGPKVFPTFAVVPAYEPLADLLSRTGADLKTVLHTGQAVRMARPIPSEATLRTVGCIEGIYDLKRMAMAVFVTRTECAGEPVCETRCTLVFRGEGRFGGDPPPRVEPPSVPDGQAPSFIHEQRTAPEQALLYRLSGDLNPLHADPAVAAAAGFERGPILHGLCTYGFLARAAISDACGGDGDRMTLFEGRFKRPVWPGQTLQTRGYQLEDGRIFAKTYAAESPDQVVAIGWAEIAG
jgi:acyl dehydratase